MLIRLENIGRRYPQQESWALRHLSLTLEAGSFTALMGPSGCGKSTLLNLLGAIDTPTQGALWIDERNVSQLDDAALTRLRGETMGYVFQFFNLLSMLTVSENIALPLGLNGVPHKEIQARVTELLDEVGLTHRRDHFPAQLSGGEMQRVAIARAVAHRPKLILADEPTGNLDTENGEKIMALLKNLSKNQGCTLIMATHSEEAAQAADRIIHIRDGQLISDSANALSNASHGRS
jgi:putative ABC transport system ATP-binding protein